MSKKVEFIDKSSYSECYTCQGKGKVNNIPCKTCGDTGTWKEDNFILVAETPDKKKIAFQVDGLK